MRYTISVLQGRETPSRTHDQERGIARFRKVGSRHDCELPRSGQVMEGVSPGLSKAGFYWKIHMKGTDTSKHSQCDAILAWLKAGNTITPLEALSRFSCMRLGARIYDLSMTGHQIRKTMIKVTNRDGKPCRVAEYSMVQGDAVQECMV